MIKQDKYTIRNMSADEVKNIAVEWAAQEGWNPGLYDADCFYKTDPNGFFVGLLDDEPIACISAVAYNDEFGFIGFYIVKPEYRGSGYGLKIWNATINYLNKQNIGLDGVVDQQSNYMKSGFRLAYRNIRYEGIAHSTADKFPEVVGLSDVSLNEIFKYDTKLFSLPRPQFLNCWFQQPESITFAAIQNGKVAGYSVIRKCRNGYKIGPLFADSKELAEKLFLSLNNCVKSRTTIYLDTPEVNNNAVELAENYCMKKVFETARMYTKSQPEIDVNKIYGVTTFELG